MIKGIRNKDISGSPGLQASEIKCQGLALAVEDRYNRSSE